MGTQFAIVDGQSKLDLFMQLFDIGRNKDRNQPVFTMKIHHPSLLGKAARAEVHMQINGIIAEDGSGNCWIITGCIIDGPSWAHPGSSFEGFYDTRIRKGHLKLR